jgi:N-acetylneuraminic acid mutarotase
MSRRALLLIAAPVLCLFGCGLEPLQSSAQQRSALSAAGMVVPHAYGSSVVLNDGRVMVLGGQSTGNNLQQTEIFDPVSNRWTRTAPMLAPRYFLSSVLLKDGRVFVVGGTTGQGAEVYDPGADTWSPLPSAPAGPIWGGVTCSLLPDGRVFCAGGHNQTVSLTAAQTFDPQTNTWTAAASMTFPRSQHAAALVGAKVLVTGGQDYGAAADRAECELYDPATNTWTTVAPLNQPHTAHAATLLTNGKVLVIGGDSSDFPERYDPLANTWTTLTNGPAERREHLTTTLLPSGHVFIAGGSDNGVNAYTTTRPYNPFTDTWSMGPALATARRGHNTLVLANGQVLVLGGVNPTDGALASAELFDLNAPSFTVTAPALVDWRSHYAVVLPSGRVLFAGGHGAEPAQARTQAALYDGESTVNAWPTTAPLLTASSWGTATLLEDGRVLVVGGRSVTPSDPAGSKRVQLYSSASETWRFGPELPQASRMLHTATLLPDGKVLIVGGVDETNQALAECLLFDAVTETFTPTGAMQKPRALHTATLLLDGTVLVTSEGTAELYDVASGTWAATGSPSIAREPAGLFDQPNMHTATLLASGKVLVTGGVGDASATSEIYEPATRTWRSVGALAQTRVTHQATLLPSGKVLVSSGHLNETQLTNPVELFDPLTETFNALPGATNRSGHSARVMRDGRVLIVGGFWAYTYAEYFDEGRGAQPGWTPTLNGPLVLEAGQTTLPITGTLFTGVSEASNGSFLGAANNRPLFELERADNGARYYPRITEWSATSASVQLPSSLPGGVYWARVIVNGVPSRAVSLVPRQASPHVCTAVSPSCPCVADAECGGGLICLSGQCTVPAAGFRPLYALSCDCQHGVGPGGFITVLLTLLLAKRRRR